MIWMMYIMKINASVSLTRMTGIEIFIAVYVTVFPVAM